MQEERILEELKSLNGRFDTELRGLHSRFDAVDGRLDAVDGRLDAMDGRLEHHDDMFRLMAEKMNTVESTQNRMLDAMLDMKKTMGTLATKEELHEVDQRVSGTLAEHTVILNRLDDERLVTNMRLTRLERGRAASA
ncbi:MAG: hypothetical protein RLZZ324_344 [Candidatus Parcubacteria bacterium]|jgi:hypothetical protein